MSISWYIVADDGTVFHALYLYWAWSVNCTYPRSTFSFDSKSEASRKLAQLRKQMPGVKATIMDRAGLFTALGRTDPQPDVVLFNDRERAAPLKLYQLAEAQTERGLQLQRSRLRPPPGITPVVV